MQAGPRTYLGGALFRRCDQHSMLFAKQATFHRRQKGDRTMHG